MALLIKEYKKMKRDFSFEKNYIKEVDVWRLKVYWQERNKEDELWLKHYQEYFFKTELEMNQWIESNSNE